MTDLRALTSEVEAFRKELADLDSQVRPQLKALLDATTVGSKLDEAASGSWLANRYNLYSEIQGTTGPMVRRNLRQFTIDNLSRVIELQAGVSDTQAIVRDINALTERLKSLKLSIITQLSPLYESTEFNREARLLDELEKLKLSVGEQEFVQTRRPSAQFSYSPDLASRGMYTPPHISYWAWVSTMNYCLDAYEVFAEKATRLLAQLTVRGWESRRLSSERRVDSVSGNAASVIVSPNTPTQLEAGEARTPRTRGRKEMAQDKSVPRVFIGSSLEGLPYANAIFSELEKTCEPTVWDQDIFVPSLGTLETLEGLVDEYDFAIMVLTADDKNTKRGRTKLAPRDNVIFELGLFIGALGRRRVFFVQPSEPSIAIPTDLLGITSPRITSRTDDNLRGAVRTACDSIKKAIKAQGCRPRGKSSVSS